MDANIKGFGTDQVTSSSSDGDINDEDFDSDYSSEYTDDDEFEEVDDYEDDGETLDEMVRVFNAQ